MKINIKVSSKANCNEVIQSIDNVNNYKVKTTAVPAKGKANEEVIKLIAEHFNIGKNCVRIVKGLKSNLKTIEVDV